MKESVIGIMGNDGMMDWIVLWSIFGLILLVAVIVAVTALIVWIVRRNSAATAGVPGEGQDPGEVLRRRFASGEIDKEEFQRCRAVLEGR